MRELEKLTNMTRATINFYIKEGILPPPKKTAKNMAYYDEEFIKKLKMIETMKKEQYTLTQIKRLLNSETGTMNDFCLQILESVNKMLPYGLEENTVTRQQIKEIGLSDQLINELIETGTIVSADKSGTLFPGYSLTICKFVKYYADYGIPLAAVSKIIGKLKEIACIEKDVFVEYIRSPMIEKNLPIEEQKDEVLRCVQNINALLPILHLQFIKLPTENLLKNGNA